MSEIDIRVGDAWWLTCPMDDFNIALGALWERSLTELVAEIKAACVLLQGDLNSRKKSEDPDAWQRGKKTLKGDEHKGAKDASAP